MTEGDFYAVRWGRLSVQNARPGWYDQARTFAERLRNFLFDRSLEELSHGDPINCGQLSKEAKFNAVTNHPVVVVPRTIQS